MSDTVTVRRDFLTEIVSDHVWNAYNAGITKDSRWMDGDMSDAEWLREELSLPDGWHDAEKIRKMLPELIERMIDSAAYAAANSPSRP